MGKEAFSRRKELVRGGFKSCLKKRMVTTDLECDLVLCRNMDSEKGGHKKIGSLLNVDMAWDGEDQLDRAHIK